MGRRLKAIAPLAPLAQPPALLLELIGVLDEFTQQLGEGYEASILIKRGNKIVEITARRVASTGEDEREEEEEEEEEIEDEDDDDDEEEEEEEEIDEDEDEDGDYDEDEIDDDEEEEDENPNLDDLRTGDIVRTRSGRHYRILRPKKKGDDYISVMAVRNSGGRRRGARATTLEIDKIVTVTREE